MNGPIDDRFSSVLAVGSVRAADAYFGKRTDEADEIASSCFLSASSVHFRETNAAATVSQNKLTKPTKTSPFPLRDYQLAAVDAVLTQPGRGVRSCHFSLPTGSGKSVVLAEIAAHRFSASRILALVPRIELADQLAEHLRRRLGDVVGVVQGERVDLAAPVVVAVVDGMRADRVAALGVVGTLIVDECHHAAPGTRYETVLKQLRRANPEMALVGCTATPLRSDDKRLGTVIGPCVFSRSIAALQDAGHLAPFEYARVVVPELKLVGGTAGDYDETQLAAAAEIAVRATVARSAPFLRERKTLAFGVTVAHAQQLAAAFETAGFRAGAVWGAKPGAQRRESIERFAAGDLNLLANCGVLTEGFDCPSVTALLMARPTRAIGLYVQMLGRGTRPFPGKSDCLIVDIAGIADPAAVPQLLLESATMREYREIAPGVRGAATGSERTTTRSLTGGFGSNHAWVSIPVVDGRKVDALACNAAAGEMLLAVPADRESGLYVAIAVTRYGKRIELLSDPEPIETIGEQLRELLESSGAAALNRADMAWRTRPASEKQLALLTRAYQGRPPDVSSAGQATNAIIVAYARKAIRRFFRGAA